MSSLNPEQWKAVSPYLDEALAMPGEERATWLAALRERNPELAAQLQVLLDEHRVLGKKGFLEQGPPGMALTPGTKLGPYVIVAPLGAGGMGEVYRARDPKLGREVALKLLPPMFTKDAERVARFQREARLLASLNHPHIGAIYGFEDAGNWQALVLELVEGDTQNLR